MARTVGSFALFGPTVTVVIGGSKASHLLQGIVDTGFTGFVLLPILMAVPLGLELDGINEYVTADGTLQQWPTAKATIEFNSQVREESITLAYTGDELLLGLDFLRSFHQSLLIHRDQVLLFDEPDLDPLLPALH